MDEYAERQQQIVERTLSAKFSLWFALLTAHTVLLSVAVALLVADVTAERSVFKFVGYLAILCVAILLLNFAVAKSQYEIIGQRLAEPEAEPTESERVQDLQRAMFRRCLSSTGETVSILGLGAEVVLLGRVLAIS